jgi:Flp pilus assembly protein TadD
MSKYSRLLKVLPAGACALALAACGKQAQQTYVIPEDGPKVDAKTLDAKTTSLRLADAAFEKGEYAMAAQLYYRAAELQPDETSVHVKLGFALFKAGNPADSEKIFRVALAKQPKNADALRGLGHSLLTQGRAAEALPLYRQAIAASAKPDARIYAGLGAALDMVGKHEEARTAYQAGLKLAPGDFGLRNNYALSYAMSGDTAKAQAILAGMNDAPKKPPKAKESLSALKAVVAKAAQAAPARPRQTAEAPAAPKPVAPPPVAPSPVAPPVTAAPDTRDVAEVPAPVRAAPAVSRKAHADLADAGDGEIYIQTGRATVVHAAAPRAPAMSYKSSADTPDAAAAEVLELLAQAERGPRFVWQEARRPDPS